MSAEFQAGQRVRLKSNPARAGVLSGQQTGNPASPRWQVIFPDRTEFVPGLALELIPEKGTNPYDDMRQLRFGRARDLRSALTHARLGGKLADLIYSLYTTNTDFYAYQFKPVLSFLDSPSRGILIADEVGLGKTIEAGLIWTELRSREDARRLLVVCPAMLQDKWREELADRFGVEARKCNAGEVVEVLEQAAGNARASFAIVTSMQGLRGLTDLPDDDEEERSLAARLRRLADDNAGGDAPLDLVVIDEAHYMRNPETQTARLGQLLRRMAENLVLLSATPVHLRNADLFHLLNLVDSDSFPHEWSFDHALQENAPLVELRDQLLRGRPDAEAIYAALDALRGSELSARSEALQFILASPPDGAALASVPHRLALAEQIDRVNPITKVVTRTRKRDVHERRVVRQPIALSAEMSPVEAGFYDQVTAAVRRYCRDLNMAEGFLLTLPQRQMCSSMAAACRSWVRRSGDLDAEIDQILWDAFGEDASLDRREGTRPNADSLISQLSRIARDVGDFAALRQHDSKFNKLRDQLLEYWRQTGGAKVVLFAYFRDTLTYLAERFAEIGVDSVVLMGGMDKQAALERFKSTGGPRLLLASEVASEGVDLQFSALLVNYDLPWNPMRIEQRIGRIDRIGQKAPRINILNLFLARTLDERVYLRLFERLRIFERALGSIEGILGEMIREMSFDLLRHELTEAQEAERIEQTRVAAEQCSRIEDNLEQEAGRLVAHGDYLQHRISAARELNRYVASEDLQAYVSDFIDAFCQGAQLVRTADGDPPVWEIDLGPTVRAEFGEFLKRERLQERSHLASPASGRQRCIFENVLRRSRSDAESISQYHPLIAFVRERLNAEERHRHPVLAALRASRGEMSGLESGVHVFAVCRWSITGEQDSERLAFEVLKLDDARSLAPDDAERLVTGAVLTGKPWAEAPGKLPGDAVGDGFEAVMDRLEARYVEYTARAGRENRDRVAFQMDQIDRQERREIERLEGLIALLRGQGKLRTIKANVGRIVKVRERAVERRARLQLRRELRHDSALVCAGVVMLE
ncbi:DEAD/DEAH box helicase family protein [Ramlibacter sp. USB13]|uniref:DEAD/DEAH box helicase family protein n=1 Tax=Ramlibacter cellulosilyticus TaxID=2764187 RepID=A0A923MPV6_9BURK|nr:SNF2-related protein [Ramlibacter cellulosilyticus]MBC5782658.1 DEAD/DEAH box helicase family protein [Ramlibacter cellulosilyticus]